VEILGKEPIAQAEDSRSFLPVLLGQTDAARTEMINHSIDGTFAIREGSWKLIEGLGSHGFSAPKNIVPTAEGPKGQLYDLATDPSEANNLWLDRPEIVERLTAQLEKRKQSGGR